MIPCAECGKSFIFAEVVEIDQTYEALAEQWFRSRGLETDTSNVAAAAQWMREAVHDLPLGGTVVHIDCCYFLSDECNIEFMGEFATHAFDRLPHAAALENPSILRDVLGNPQYWFDRERADRKAEDDE